MFLAKLRNVIFFKSLKVKIFAKSHPFSQKRTVWSGHLDGLFVRQLSPMCATKSFGESLKRLLVYEQRSTCDCFDCCCAFYPINSQVCCPTAGRMVCMTAFVRVRDLTRFACCSRNPAERRFGQQRVFQGTCCD